MCSHERPAPVIAVLRKEVRELITGNALWVLLLLSPLVGYSIIQAVALYAEASRPALSIPELARQFSPFGGVLVPSLGGFYLAITLLFPFIAIRLVATEKTSGGLKLLVQRPRATALKRRDGIWTVIPTPTAREHMTDGLRKAGVLED